MFDFMKNTVVHKRADKMGSLFEMYRSYGLDFEKMYADFYTRNVDYSRFRDPTAVAETINIVRWSLEKYAEEKLLAADENSRLDFGRTAAELSRYIDIMKEAFYTRQE
jgi:PhoPQ-activated pathogenicity-related protein